MKFKAMKFNIGKNYPLVSEAVQEILFNLGYAWGGIGRSKHVQTSMPHLYVSVVGLMTYGDDDDGFDRHNAPEINIEWMKPEERGTVIIGGKTYYEDELAEALSKIKEVEQ